MKASYFKHILNFKEPSGTSRGVLRQKETWFIKLNKNEQWGIGECGLLKGLSCDDRPDYEDKLKWVCEHIHLGKEVLYEEMNERGQSATRRRAHARTQKRARAHTTRAPQSRFPALSWQWAAPGHA